MSTLEEIKEQYARKNGFESFKDLIDYCKYWPNVLQNHNDKITKIHTSQQVKEALERAAEEATIIELVDGEIIDEYTATFIEGVDYEINKESILSLIKEY